MDIAELIRYEGDDGQNSKSHDFSGSCAQIDPFDLISRLRGIDKYAVTETSCCR